MTKIRPFQGIRPCKEKAAVIAALPYDVYNREEATEEVARHPDSFLKIDRAETQFGPEVGTYDPCVYEKAREIFETMRSEKQFIQDKVPCFYLYELTMEGKSQTGIVACASIDEYHNGIIKKHENTRREKEEDRVRHVDALSAQTGPIFLAYRANEQLDAIIQREKEKEPLYDFEAEDGIRHRVFQISDAAQIKEIERIFELKIPNVYIADGHHRAASAVRVGDMRRKAVSHYTGEEEFNFFLSVLFPDKELRILDYNRVVKDLNGFDTDTFLRKVSAVFEIEMVTREQALPQKKGEIGMFLGEQWYKLRIKEQTRPNDPVEGLDVSYLQNQFLDPVLGIRDPKTDTRIDFVGGIRGKEELERRVHTDCAVAFAMYPTSIAELFEVADAGRLMPPKSTWFEPKLRSGLLIHEIERIEKTD
ncbi:MAG: DUF1015 domain-containing protein [Lachnospiraceae bacterium]